MAIRKVALLVVVILLIGAVAGLARHLDDYARSPPQEERSVTRLVLSPSLARVEAPELSELASTQASSAPTDQADPSLVGLPFELSRSVRDNCRRFEGDCRELQEFLERMASEPRNADWARAMEARIEKAVMSGEQGKFRIRALECRSTRCALEVASEVDDIGIEFESDPDFNENMFPRSGYFAREDDPQTGITTMVSAQTWQTAASFDAEELSTE